MPRHNMESCTICGSRYPAEDMEKTKDGEVICTDCHEIIRMAERHNAPILFGQIGE